MRVEQGYEIGVDPVTGKVVSESALFKCAHCEFQVRVKSLRNHGYSICHNCEDGMGRGLLCNKPSCHAECRPFMKKIEAMEARERFRCWI